MFNPGSTYRIQFHAGFTFRQLFTVLPYLKNLGIQTIYASPVFKAVPGSTHGYDGLDPNQINPEIGTLDELRELSIALKDLGMYWIQDIVPNHMAFHPQNFWLMDVLKNGEQSSFRNYFDICSDNLETAPLMLPFLGTDLDQAIESGDLQLHQEDGDDYLRCYDQYWPLRPDSPLGAPLKSLIEFQYYRPCSHLETNDRINYRRFFTVNDLICLNMQREETFEHYHRLITALVKEGIVQGLRIDHVDGLLDPLGYLQRLRRACGEDTYIVVEKILESGETLPLEWPVQGTTGYDYLGLLNQLFTNQKAEGKFSRFYRKMNHIKKPVEAQIRSKKRAFLYTAMNGELDNLLQLFLNLTGKAGPEYLDDHVVFRRLIAEVMVRLPVYRLYSQSFPLKKEERQLLERIFSSLKGKGRFLTQISLLRSTLLEGSVEFYVRLMQFTGPLMAKGVEDTLMYTFNRFIGNNEVGDTPGLFGISAKDFYSGIQDRQALWPLSMNAGSTHDTKRGEDARARLNGLTDLREEWVSHVNLWREMNSELRHDGSPDENDEYFIYQTLISTWPENQEDQTDYPDRLLAYIQKALREAKRHSAWVDPDLSYEKKAARFIKALLDTERPFWQNFAHFHARVAVLGRMISLSSLLIRLGSPGIPDIYQGTELWDLSMVDPDNRRPVDYQKAASGLPDDKSAGIPLASLWKAGADGRIKQRLLQRLLLLRLQFPLLFAEGDYVPLEVTGRHAKHVIAFGRRHGADWMVFIAPLNWVALSEKVLSDIGGLEWGDTAVVLPPQAPLSYHERLRDINGKCAASLELSEILSDLPLAVVHLAAPSGRRAAGVLMPVSALPADYGIGDLGPSSSGFLEFLAASGQSFWQVLPLHPSSAEQAFSPYSGLSVMAGNPLLISPELLLQHRLLQPEDLEELPDFPGDQVDYVAVRDYKERLLSIAFDRFKARADLLPAFDHFCARSAWLENYALFEVIKAECGGAPWPEWPAPWRTRDAAALKAFAAEHAAQIEKVKWIQHTFFAQWDHLRKQARQLGIQLIGDLPFYAALDSADVWGNPQWFKVKSSGEVIARAGVPPDYFNEEGQLWGMPVYDWGALSAQDFSWWQDRIAHNVRMFDWIRLDHFRAFSACWEVPAASASAKNGSWHPVPGRALFRTFQDRFKSLPFIAEDLGEITDEVYLLRDEFGLPGMRVLQFAFGPDMADSIHAPHRIDNTNCVLYTGTHDNNTIRDWFGAELDTASRTRLYDYLGQKPSAEKVAELLIRSAYCSVADWAIIPLQDWLNIGGEGRINTPGTTEGNWTWRCKAKEISQGLRNKMLKMARTYGRY